MLIRLPTLAEPPWSSDDGFFTAIAVAMSKGVTLYKGVYDDQPPMIFWLYRVLVALGSPDHHFVVQLAACAAVVASALLTYTIARRAGAPEVALWAGALAGVALSIPTLDGDLMNVELAALPFFLGALALSFSRRPVPLLAAGVLLGLALATRPSFLVDSLAVAVPLLSGSDRRRRMVTVAAGGAVTFLVVVGALWLMGSLAAYVNVVMPSDHAYLAWANGGTLVPLYLRLVLLGLGGVAVAWRTRSLPGRLAAVWFFASFAGSSLTPRELTHYSHEFIPALAFAMALVASRVRWRAIGIAASAAAVIVGAELVLFLPAAETARFTGASPPLMLHGISYAQLPDYYANWGAYAVGMRDWKAYANWFPGDTSIDAAEADQLRSITGRAPARMIVLGDRPWLFVFSGALPASLFIATNSAFWQVAGSADHMDARLRAGCADVVVYQSGPGDWTAALAAGGYQRVSGTSWPTYRRSVVGGAGIEPATSCV